MLLAIFGVSTPCDVDFNFYVVLSIHDIACCALENTTFIITYVQTLYRFCDSEKSLADFQYHTLLITMFKTFRTNVTRKP